MVVVNNSSEVLRYRSMYKTNPGLLGCTNAQNCAALSGSDDLISKCCVLLVFAGS